MSAVKVETLIIGGGQAGLAMSEHLSKHGAPHLVVERHRIAERWRSERWDSLVANGPAWHDRFPSMTFSGIDPDSFATGQIVDYFVAYAEQIAAPIRCGVEVTALRRKADGSGFRAETSEGVIEATNVVVATGPFQRPIIPTVVPADAGIVQIHSTAYRNPGQLPRGGGAGGRRRFLGRADRRRASRAGRRVYLSVGPHNRPPRRYRGRDFVWWLGVLGQWDAKAVDPGMEHVTIAVSGAYGGHTVDFRRSRRARDDAVGQGGSLQGRRDAVRARSGDAISRSGDANYCRCLNAADAYVAQKGLDLPAGARGPQDWSRDPPLRDRSRSGVEPGERRHHPIIWATGYALDFGWLKVDAFDEKGRPVHQRGVSAVPGLYFLGLAWLSRRASPFIWGVWHDAEYLAGHIAARNGSLAAKASLR